LPGLLPIKAGATRLLERGKNATTERTGPCASNKKMRRTVSGSGPPFLAALDGENSRAEGQNVRKDNCAGVSRLQLHAFGIG
jgi:hypothetical protein